MMGLDEFIATTAANGFPIMVAAYLLIRMENEMRALRMVIENLRHCQTCKHSPIHGGEEKK